MRKIILGPPGSGKGTVSSRLSPMLNIPHISTGDLLRKNIREQTELGLSAKEFIEKGLLVPDEIVIGLLKQRISESDCEKGFILDGFPRTIPQAEELQKITQIDFVLNLNVTDDVIILRNSSRVICNSCGEVYNLRSLPPKEQGKCDKCSGEVIRRKDDEPEIIKERLLLYQNQTLPLIDFYKQQGILSELVCETIEQTPSELLQEVVKLLKEKEFI